MEPIDFVVTWLDGTDPAWQKDYSYYKGEEYKPDSGRFRNWDFFRYWFRAVEKHAPWVRKVFLVTNGKFPDWINPNCDKMVLVKHSDFIPESLLPTFNSITIELFLHRIPGLSEHFVYFNDDFFLNADIDPDYYFRDGLPQDNNIESVFCTDPYDERDRFGINIQMFVDIAVLNRNFSRKEVIKKAPGKWLRQIGREGILTKLLLSRRDMFIGFEMRHCAQPYLKSVQYEVWEKEERMLMESASRFRKDISLIFIYRYWQFATNKFSYSNVKRHEKAFPCKPEALDEITKTLNDPNIKCLCLNDSPLVNEKDYSIVKPAVLKLLSEKYPSKSAFEA